MSDQCLQDGFHKFKEHIVIITRLAICFTIFGLFGISIGMLANHHYPLLAAYALLVGLGMVTLEVGVGLLHRIDLSDKPFVDGVKDKLSVVAEWLTPLKKCILYVALALPLFIHMSVAFIGALMLLTCSVLLAAQYEDRDRGVIPGDNQGYGYIGVPASFDNDAGEFLGENPIQQTPTPSIPTPSISTPSIPTPSIPSGVQSPRSEPEWDLLKDDDPLVNIA